MAFNGSGTFERIYNWVNDKANGYKITASRMDGEFDGIATGLSQCITKDGQTTISANIPMSNYKFTGLGNGSSRTDSIALGQVQDGTYTYLGTTSGSADAYTLTPSPSITAYATTQQFTVKIHATNTTTTPYLQISAIANPTTTAVIKKLSATKTEIAVEASDLLINGIYDFQRNSANDAWIVLNPEKPSNKATTTFQGISYLKPNINLIINGAMQIDQRNSGNSQTITAGSTLAYTVDRWYAYCTGANCTGQRVVGTSPNQYNYRFTGASSVSKIGFAQRIEASNSQHLANKSATLSVDLANSLLSSITWTMWYANTADTFGTLASPTRTQIATGSFTVNSNLNRYETTISIPASATTGIEIEFSVGAQTSGTWTIGRVQLEDSLSSTPFEQRSLAIEEILCYRYYIQKSLNGGVGIGFDTTSISMTVNFPVVLRGTPTQSLLSGSLLVNDAVASTNRSSTGSTIVQSNNTKHGSRFRVNGFTGITAGRPYTLEDTFDVYSASAELN
jgi:hypothetical protein